MSFAAAASGASESNDHQAQFKKTFDPDAGTLKRRELNVSLRKGSRASALSKRRQATDGTATAIVKPATAASAAAAAAGTGTDSKAAAAATTASNVIGPEPAADAERRAVIHTAMNHIKTALLSPKRAAALVSLRTQLAAAGAKGEYAAVDACCSIGVVPILTKLLSQPPGTTAAAADSTAPAAAAAAAADQTAEVLGCFLELTATDNIGHTAHVVQSGAVVYLIQLLSSSPYALHACWCLANIASEDDEYRRLIIKNGAAVPLIKLLTLTGNTLAKTAATAAVSTATATAASSTATAAASGFTVPKFAAPATAAAAATAASAIVMSSPEKKTASAAAPATAAATSTAVSPALSLARIVVWCVSNLLRPAGSSAGASVGGDPAAVLRELTKHGLGAALALHISTATDESLVSDICWTLCHITHFGDEWIEPLLKASLIPYLLHQLRDGGFASALVPCVRALAHVVSGKDDFSSHLLSHPTALPILARVMRAAAGDSSRHRGLLKECIWTLSNIAGGPTPHVEAIVKSGEVAFVAHLFNTVNVVDIKRECAYLLRNVSRFNSQTIEQQKRAAAAAPKPFLRVLIDEYKVLPGFIGLCRAVDSDVVHVALTFIAEVLQSHPNGVRLVEETNGIDALEQIKIEYYRNEYTDGESGVDERRRNLAEFAERVLDRHFGEDAPYDDDAQPQQTANGGTEFAFGDVASTTAAGSVYHTNTSSPPQRPPAPNSNAAAAAAGRGSTALPPQRAAAPTNLTGPAFIPLRPKK